MSKKHIFSHLLILTTLIMIFSAFSFLPAKAQEKYYTPEEIQARVRNLESLNLLKGLHLNAGQMKKLLVLLYEARLAEKEVLEGFKKDSLHAIKMMNMLTEKLKKGEGIDVETEETVWFSLGTLYEYEYDRYRIMEKLVDDARNILNKNQLRIVSEYMPCVIPWSTVKAPERIGQSGSIAKLEKILDKLRTLKGGEYKKEKRLFLVELDWRLRIDRHEDDKTRQILVRKIDEKIDKICKLPENEYQIRKEDLAQSIRPPDLEILPPRVGEELNEYIAEYILNPANIEYLQCQLEARGVKDYPKLDDTIDKDIDSKVEENNKDMDVD
ncbi:MAG: hypothetical protein K8T10_05280 [Candidatus Eremiobacteraeota bacterium]|nr:hypothetical protein [Candidatus Eremiobacteraeota bacterium]